MTRLNGRVIFLSIFRNTYASINDGIKSFNPMMQIRTLRWGFIYEGRKVNGKDVPFRKLNSQL